MNEDEFREEADKLIDDIGYYARRVALAEGERAGLEKAAQEAGKWQGLKGRLISAKIEAISKNAGASGAALITALSSVTAQAIRLYSAEHTDAGRAACLNAFVDAVKDCLDQD